MTNKEIRRRAWTLCRENFWTILGATFLMSLISTMMLNLVSMPSDSLLPTVAMIALSVLSTIMNLGLIRFILDIWHGQPTALSVLFSQRRRFWTSVLSSMLLGLIFMGILIAFSILIVVFISVSETLGSVIAIIATIAICVLILWIALRFDMTAACIVLRPSLGATDCMRASWRASKGNVGRLFCNMFVLNLPLVAAETLLIGYQTFLYANGQTLNAFGSIVLDVASTLISALLTGYIALGTYALHEQLLDSIAFGNVKNAAELWEPTLPEAGDSESAAEESSDSDTTQL